MLAFPLQWVTLGRGFSLPIDSLAKVLLFGVRLLPCDAVKSFLLSHFVSVLHLLPFAVDAPAFLLHKPFATAIAAYFRCFRPVRRIFLGGKKQDRRASRATVGMRLSQLITQRCRLALVRES